MTDPTFLGELVSLRKRWSKIPPVSRPRFPLSRLPHPAGKSVEAIAKRSRSKFSKVLKDFLDKWGLLQLVTWDLPEPQGPLFLNPLDADCAAIPVHGIHVYLPLHYPIQGIDHFWKLIDDCQQKIAAKSGLPEGLAGLPHWQAQVRIFKIQHLERSIGARFPNQEIPQGLTGQVIEAISDATGLSVDKVARYRKDIELCLSGRRNEAEFTQPRKAKKTNKKK